MFTQVPRGAHGNKAVIGEQTLYDVGLTCADFDCEMTSRFQVTRGFGDQPSHEVQSVEAAREGEHWLVFADVALQLRQL